MLHTRVWLTWFDVSDVGRKRVSDNFNIRVILSPIEQHTCGFDADE